jgi:dihydropteroate synthase
MPITIDEILNSHRTRRPIVMGVLNVTPDSFSDGGRFFDARAAVAHASRMIDQGAEIIDIGAESTRPGSNSVPPDEQTSRLKDILPAVVDMKAPVSIDTTSSEVASFALQAGATIVNDISAGRDDPKIFSVAARHNAAFCLMHMLGTPKTMQDDPQYDDVVEDVRTFLAERVAAAESVGVQREHIIIDPGIGFGKRLKDNLALLACINRLAELDLPVLVGPSRKRFIGELTGVEKPQDRLGGTIAACLAARRGGASIFRVHDVAAVVQALNVAAALEQAGS